MKQPRLVTDYHWDAWEGEVITRMYERAEDNALVIEIETGRVIIIEKPEIQFSWAKAGRA